MLFTELGRPYGKKLCPWSWVRMRDVIHLMFALRGFGGPTECPWAWWWRAWRGWRTSWCLQTDQQGKPRWLLEEPLQRSSGNADRSWNPEQFLAQDTGRTACESAARWISGTTDLRNSDCTRPVTMRFFDSTSGRSHQASHSSSCSLWRCQANLWPDLRGD